MFVQSSTWFAVAKRAYVEVRPLFDTELLQPIPPLNRRNGERPSTYADRRQPEPDPGQYRASDGIHPWPIRPLTYAD